MSIKFDGLTLCSFLYFVFLYRWSYVNMYIVISLIQKMYDATVM